ncbi:hypothetical protein HK405_015469 [Cladochytrium tenue]|nr:hypothetical protein HK405_015469 [Cladochytrium tenue]
MGGADVAAAATATCATNASADGRSPVPSNPGPSSGSPFASPASPFLPGPPRRGRPSESAAPPSPIAAARLDHRSSSSPCYHRHCHGLACADPTVNPWVDNSPAGLNRPPHASEAAVAAGPGHIGSSRIGVGVAAALAAAAAVVATTSVVHRHQINRSGRSSPAASVAASLTSEVSIGLASAGRGDVSGAVGAATAGLSQFAFTSNPAQKGEIPSGFFAVPATEAGEQAHQRLSPSPATDVDDCAGGTADSDGDGFGCDAGGDGGTGRRSLCLGEQVVSLGEESFREDENYRLPSAAELRKRGSVWPTVDLRRLNAFPRTTSDPLHVRPAASDPASARPLQWSADRSPCPPRRSLLATLSPVPSSFIAHNVGAGGSSFGMEEDDVLLLSPAREPVITGQSSSCAAPLPSFTPLVCHDVEATLAAGFYLDADGGDNGAEIGQRLMKGAGENIAEPRKTTPIGATSTPILNSSPISLRRLTVYQRAFLVDHFCDVVEDSQPVLP